MKHLQLLAILIALALVSCKNTTEAGDTEQQKALTDSLYEQGEVITQAVFDSLRTELMAAITEKGFPAAVAYCNAEAMPITQQLEESFGVSITRATDRPRSPGNSATSLELGYIQAFRDSLAKDAAPKPILIRDEDSGNYHYFKPIFTMGLCLNCHGVKDETLNPDVLQVLTELYPNDMATGYADKELRGTWHIVFK